MADQRLIDVNNFITRRHSISDDLQPGKNVLSLGLTVCIIGAGQGIGEHIAYAYAKARVSKLIIAARTVVDLEKVADVARHIHPGIDVIVTPCDIASATSVEKLADTIQSTCGRLDILICNAGYAGPVTLKVDQGRPEWVQQAFDVNVMGTYHAAHYLVPLLLASDNGARCFLQVGSMAGCIRRGIIANTGYCISKMAQIRFVEYLNEQYGAQGLFALTIHPGAVMTNMSRGNTPDDFIPYLIDPVDLCGAVCVWLSTKLSEIGWLSGRFIQATWDMEELLSKRETILEKDLLKFSMVVY